MITRNREILYYAQALLGNKTGVGYYNKVLLEQIMNTSENNSTITLAYFEGPFSRKNTNYLRKNYPQCRLKAHRIIPIKIALKLIGTTLEPGTGLLWPGTYTAAIYPNFYGFRTSKPTKFILSIPDIGFALFPEVLPEGRKGLIGKLLPSGPDYLLRATRKQVPQADIILTISETVKKEISSYFTIPEQKIIVTSVAPSYDHKSTATPQNVELPKNYFLFVGTIEPRKNLLTLLSAYETLPEPVKNTYSLVLLGGTGWKSEKIVEKIHELQNKGLSIELLGYVGDEEKVRVYKNAKIYIQPSIYEGLGLPLLEAMDYRTPIICSDIPVFREFASEIGFFFNTNNHTDLAKKIEFVLNSSKIVDKHILKGAKYVEEYRRDMSGVREMIDRIESGEMK